VLDASYSNKAIDTARAINPFIRKQMEQMRHDKIIGSSLDAEGSFDKHTRTCFNTSIIFFADWMNSSIRSNKDKAQFIA
jgi:hypothetical protein